MGWTSYHATHYKNGKIDRKAECDAMWNDDPNFEVLKSSMVGRIYYAAIKRNATVFGVVFITSTDAKDYFNFSYKDMDETVGPYRYDCPKSILDVLSPTDNEYAKEWRRKCYEKIEKQKSPNALSKLPEDTIIQVVLPWDTQYRKEGDVVKLIKIKWNKRTRWFVLNTNTYFSKRMMEVFENNYELIQRGEN